MSNIFAFPKLMRAGLGNMLVPWAKCYLWCVDNNAKMIDPFWTKFRLGPYIRGERDIRRYGRLFHHHHIHGLRRIYLLLTSKKIKVENFSHIDDINRNCIIIFEGMAGFQTLLGRSLEVKSELERITKKRFLPGVMRNGFIGIHVRFGDYSTNNNACHESWHSRIHISWYLSALREIRKQLGFDMEALVFSDGSDFELHDLLCAPNVSRSPYSESITDLLALSHAGIIIGSCSSFSMWGAYLSQAPVVWKKGRRPGSVLDDINLECEWLEGEKFDENFLVSLRKFHQLNNTDLLQLNR
ncbi:MULTISPECIES: alpha-1,2-fucosyltransferase [unclassified Polaromonas]|jgi:hypothetical protein|uniref:alpha-1,2-fucosyltransferase n=1 Tax=unclassified Polaromonas TaxID=2638319 RepID=UPI0025D1E512|nr:MULTISPECIES: alpha-1,2-fucosyltransferase [unclassified Polaromonas]